ncbi:uncharacterized protein [Lepeophtheirus salmonis]|uniref:uncharacterized protein n=1 Tax=Lepeophtheirus salmonis TaxID=72036 RepID=UPI00077F1787|nr:uncharacterized protein LOC121123027 [Lepeophtheirus salmonis]
MDLFKNIQMLPRLTLFCLFSLCIIGGVISTPGVESDLSKILLKRSVNFTPSWGKRSDPNEKRQLLSPSLKTAGSFEDFLNAQLDTQDSNRGRDEISCEEKHIYQLENLLQMMKMEAGAYHRCTSKLY